MVKKRNAKTLMENIKKYINFGSLIFSDCWKGYSTNGLVKAEYQHYQVNHKYNFVDSKTGTHTQNVERMWGSAKWRNKRQRGTARHHLNSYLAEFIWRRNLKENYGFPAILSAISTIFPPKIEM